MMRTHPHAEATYEVVSLADGGSGVEISIPDTDPTTVSSFDTVGAAEAWIGDHRIRVGPQSEAAGDSPT
jgi:hypothetical protein